MRKPALAFTLVFVLCSLISAQSGRHEFLVELKSAQSIDKLNRKFGTTTVKEIRNSIYVIAAQGASVSAAGLSADSSVEAAEENSKFKLGDDTVTIYLLDGGEREILNGTDVPKAYAQQPALSIIEGDKVRGISTGAGARVAIVDTGADFFHPALRPWLAPGVDLVSGISAAEDDQQATLAMLDSFPMTDLSDVDHAALGSLGSLLNQGFTRRPGSLPSALGHGTLVAGIVHLIAPDAVLVPIKAFDSDGNTTLSRIVESVYRAKDLGVDVLNMSFSSSQDSPILRKAINAAKASGMTVVSAMGNEGRNVGSVFPASYTSVLGVAASDLSDNLAMFSNYGKSVSLCAPGAYVISTTAGGKYAVVSGTSFSAPLVSGTAALIASLRPHGNSEGPMILQSTDPLGFSTDPNFQVAIGRLNVKKTLERVVHAQ